MSTDTCVLLSFQLGYEFIFYSDNLVLHLSIEMQHHQVDTFTMITFFLGNTIGVKQQISFRTILLRYVSFHVLGNISWQLNYPP